MTLFELIWFVLAWLTGLIWVHALQLLGAGDAAWFAVVLGYPAVLGFAWMIDRFERAPRVSNTLAIVMHVGLIGSLLLLAVGFRDAALVVHAPVTVMGIVGLLGWAIASARSDRVSSDS